MNPSEFSEVVEAAAEGDEITVRYDSAHKDDGTEMSVSGEVLEAEVDVDDRLGRTHYVVEFENEDNVYRVTGNDRSAEESPTLFTVRYDLSQGERSTESGTRRVSTRRGVSGVEIESEDVEESEEQYVPPRQVLPDPAEQEISHGPANLGEARMRSQARQTRGDLQ